MNALRPLIFAACLAVAGHAATIEGRVRLPPPSTAPVPNQRYDVVTHGTALALDPPLAVVYLEGDFPKLAKPVTVALPQRDMAFVPSLLAIQTGSRVEFPNEDDTFHNVFSFSKTKRFDLGRYQPDERPIPSVLFDRPGLVVLRCEIHEHMRGLILVVDTPHFAVTNPDGSYRLTDVPAGRYTLKAWVDSESTRSQPVEVGADGTLRVDFAKP